MKKLILTKEKEKLLFSIFEKMRNESIDEGSFLHILNTLEIRRVASCGDQPIEMWWSFFEIINESKNVVACRCPSINWYDEDDANFAVLLVPRDLAFKILSLGFVPSCTKISGC